MRHARLILLALLVLAGCSTRKPDRQQYGVDYVPIPTNLSGPAFRAAVDARILAVGSGAHTNYPANTGTVSIGCSNILGAYPSVDWNVVALGAGPTPQYNLPASGCADNDIIGFYVVQGTGALAAPTFASTGGGNGIAFVQQGTNAAASANTLAVTLGSPVGAGNALVTTLATYGSTAPTIADQLGGTWSSCPASPPKFDSSTFGAVTIFYSLNRPAGSTTVTASLTGHTEAMNVSEYSGVATSAALDVCGAGATGGGAIGTAVVTGSTGTLNNANDLIIGASGLGGNVTSSAILNGFTALTDARSEDTVFSAYKLVTATTATSTGWTASSAVYWAGEILALKATPTNNIIGNSCWPLGVSQFNSETWEFKWDNANNQWVTACGPTIPAQPLLLGMGGGGLVQATTQTVTTNGTAVAAGVTQAQPGVTITGMTTSSWCSCTPATLPATWQTGIHLTCVPTANTATCEVTNPTAASITPAAITLNVRAMQ